MSAFLKHDTKRSLEQRRSPATPSILSESSDTGNLALCVDLDGTLIKSDLLWEGVVALLKSNPLLLLRIPLWLLKGKANLKKELANHAPIKASQLPYRKEVIEFLRLEHASGRCIVLTTACDLKLANVVAEYVGIFSSVCASDGSTNLKGSTKAQRLKEMFSEYGFEYVGDSPADLAVWRAAKAGYVVGDESLARRASKVTMVRRVFTQPHASLKTWVQALRGHHWFKNVLLFLPLALAHNPALFAWFRTALGFVLFGTCASGLYILNDLLDLHSDRGHPWKQKRPIASGDIPIAQGLAISLIFLAGSLTAAFALSPKFGFCVFGYGVLTLWYSISIKKIVLLDVFLLSSFYSVRLLAGALITATPLSQWFLVFSLFFFLSLAMAKRYSELVHAEHLIDSGNSGRGYIANDRELILD